MKKVLSELASLYPNRKEVFQTSDGLIHLTFNEAEAQAFHLQNKAIKTLTLPRK